MELSRRDFLKASGAGVGGAFLLGILKPGSAQAAPVKPLPLNPWRLKKVLYRAPGASDWQEKDWGWAITEIVSRIKKTRDASFIEKDGKGNIVNRTEAVANLGGSALDNEECYLLSKLNRALGVVYLEHHARI